MKMNDSFQNHLEEHGKIHELPTKLLHQTLSSNTDFNCTNSKQITESFSHQCQEISHNFPLNTNDETANILPSFESTFIKKIYPNGISLASNNENHQVKNLSVDFQFEKQIVSNDNKAQNSIGSLHNSELIDVSYNIEPADRIELYEVSQQKESQLNVGSTHQLEDDVETGKSTFLSTSGIAIENSSSDVLELEVHCLSRKKENICPDCGNAFTSKTKSDQHNVVLDGCICKRKAFPQSSSNKEMLTRTEDAVSVASPSHSKILISDEKQRTSIKNCNLKRNKLIHERNTFTNNAPEVAISSGTHHHNHAEVPHKPYVKRRSKLNSSYRTSGGMPGNSSLEDLESEVASSSELKGHICQERGKDIISKSKLKRHSDVHTGAKPFVCDICQKSYNRKFNLNTHKKIQHPETFQMPRANTIVRTSRDIPGNSSRECLGVEAASISEQKGHICQESEKDIISKPKLKRHSVVHTGAKPFVCDICQKSYNHATNLYRHKRIHHPKTFPMPRANTIVRTSKVIPSNSSRGCLGFEVASSSELKRHICQECGIDFKLKSLLKRQSVVHTSEKPFDCDICKKPYTRKGSLNRHKCNQHPETFQM